MLIFSSQPRLAPESAFQDRLVVNRSGELPLSMVTLIYAPTGDEVRPVLADVEARRHFFSTRNQTTPVLDLDKTWHGLHYLLTGSAWEGEGPTAFLVEGGELMGVGVRSARVFWPNEVEAIHSALAAVTPDELRRRFDPQAMMREEVYPQIWDRDPKQDDTLGELVLYFAKLKEFVANAHAQARCIVVDNEWPAVTGDEVLALPRLANRRWMRLAPLAIVALSAALTACAYPLIPRSNASLLSEISILYFLAALTVLLLATLLESCVRRSKKKEAWLLNIQGALAWASAN